MISPITQQKFVQYRERFLLEIQKSPVLLEIGRATVSSIGPFTDFTGDSARTETKHSFKCLYERTVNEFQRQKYGIEMEIKAVVFLSPQHLIDAYGTFRLGDFLEQLKVYLYEEDYQVSQVVYLEPLYDSCIAVRLDLKDTHKGVE